MVQLGYKHRLVGVVVLIQFILITAFLITKRPHAIEDGLIRLTSSWPFASSTNHNPKEQPWPPTADGYVGAIVAAAQANTDMQWIEQVRNQSWLPQVYNVDSPYEGENTLTVMRNKGHEAMVYLTYIVDNYAALPPYTIFIHGHLESWHQHSDIYSVIRNVRLAAVEEQGYISLRCDWYPSCPAELKLIHHDAHVWGPGVHRQDAEDAISDNAWQTFFPNTSMPETIASQCCAQFIVTAQAIRRNSRDDYLRMRQWILDTPLIDDISGRVLEKLWAYIMTGNAVNCPSPHTCACEFFGKCEKQNWPAPPIELGPLPEDSQWP